MTHTASRVLLGSAAVVAGAGTVVGAFLPWVSTFAGLQTFASADGLYGQVLAGLGVLVAVSGLVLLWRETAVGRWVLLASAVVAALLSGWMLARSEGLYASLAADPFTVAERGPGGFVALACALVAVALALTPVAQRDR